MPYGTLYTLDVSRIDDPKIAHVKHKFFIVRSCKSPNALLQRGWRIVPELAPSPALFKKYLDLAKQKKWNQQSFDNIYTPEFLYQMGYDNDMRQWLNYIRTLLMSGEDVAIACYCPDFKLCHRHLVGSAYIQRGYKVVELSIN